MGYLIDTNAKNVWVRDNADTEDLSVMPNASSVYFNNGRTMEQEFGKGAMSSNIATVDSGVEKVIDGTYDGAYESCKMCGRTLKSLFTRAFTLDPNKMYSQISGSHDDVQIEVGKEYTVIIDVYKNNSNCSVGFKTYGCTITPRDGLGFQGREIGRKVAKVVFTEKKYYRWFWFETNIADEDATEPIECELTVIDGDYRGMVLDHFEGLCDVKAPILKNVGKNILPKEIGEWYSCYFKKGTTFQLTTKDNIPSKGGNIVFVDGSGAKMWMGIDSGTTKKTYTLPNDAYKISNQLTSGVEYQLEININATLYEDYKTNILETSNDVVLRGLPNGVKDSYDCLTGEYVQRIGEIVFDGSNDENWFENNNFPHNGQIVYGIRVTNLNGGVPYPDGISDTLPFIRKGYESNKPSVSTYMKDIYVRINGSTKEDLKAYLSQNPITVQYELAEPIVTTIEPSTTPFAYENGHIILESGHEGQSLLPTLEYQTVVSRSGQVAMIDKTIQQHERKITLLEKMLVQNIIDIEYKNTLLALKLEINEVI